MKKNIKFIFLCVLLLISPLEIDALNIDTVTLSGVYFDDQKVTKIYFNNELVWSGIKEPIYWIQNQAVVNEYPSTLTLMNEGGYVQGTGTLPSITAEYDNYYGHDYTIATTENINTKGYRYITLTFYGACVYASPGSFVDPSRVWVYASDGTELFYTATNGTYTVDISNTDKIYLKLFAADFGDPCQITRINELYFHDE